MVSSSGDIWWDSFIGNLRNRSVVRGVCWQALMHMSPAEDCSHSASSFGRMQVRRGAMMLKTIEGVYRDSKVELTEVPKDVRDETRVLVTCLEPQAIDLRVHPADWA
jgi:hypothetical protein